MYSSSASFCILVMRGILLFCLLSGLFLSGGEGVRLLPFPDSELPDRSASITSFGGFKSFQLSVGSSENSDGICQLKLRARALDQSAGGNSSIEVPLRAAIATTVRIGSFERNTSNTTASFTILSGRAPPVSDPNRSRNS